MKNDNISLILGNFTWEVESRQLRRNVCDQSLPGAEHIVLTPKQYQLLKCLLDAHPETLQNEQIVEKVWGTKHTSAESLPQLINRTRLAIEDESKNIIVNEPGVGYSLHFQHPDEVPSTATEAEVIENVTSIESDIPSARPITDVPINRLWLATFVALGLLTVFNGWEAARALYYKTDYEQVLHSKPYPEIKTLENGKVIVTIDNHECIYEKNQLLLQCP